MGKYIKIKTEPLLFIYTLLLIYSIAIIDVVRHKYNIYIGNEVIGSLIFLFVLVPIIFILSDKFFDKIKIGKDYNNLYKFIKNKFN